MLGIIIYLRHFKPIQAAMRSRCTQAPSVQYAVCASTFLRPDSTWTTRSSWRTCCPTMSRCARPVPRLPLCSTAAAVAHVRASPDRHGAGLERQAAASDRTSSCYCALRTKSPRSASEVARNGPSRHIHTGARARWRPAQVLGSSAQTSRTTCGRPTRADH